MEEKKKQSSAQLVSAAHKKELNLNLIHELPSKPRKDGQYHGLTSVALLEKWSVLLSTQHGPLSDPERRPENYLCNSVRISLVKYHIVVFNHSAQQSVAAPCKIWFLVLGRKT